MYCKNHSNNKVTNTCSICGEWICEECLLNIEDRNYCKDCLKETLQNNKALRKTENTQINTKIEKYTDKIEIENSFFKNIFFYGISLLPGCGQIYLGKSIKGIALLSVIILLFFGLNPFFALPIYFYSFFDSIILKRKTEILQLIKKNNLEEENFHYLGINKKPNFLLTVCYSLMPGCGQMYLGYTYYGITLNIIFFILFLNITPLSIIPYLFSFFNAIYLRKQILNGVYFDDSIKSILEIIKSINNNKITKETIIDKRINKSEREN